MATSIDIRVECHGSVFLLRPRNKRASDWLRERVVDDAQWFTGALVVQQRYIADIVPGANAMGLRVRRDFGGAAAVTPSSSLEGSDIAAADDELVPCEIGFGDPARLAE